MDSILTRLLYLSWPMLTGSKEDDDSEIQLQHQLITHSFLTYEHLDLLPPITDPSCAYTPTALQINTNSFESTDLNPKCWNNLSKAEQTKRSLGDVLDIMRTLVLYPTPKEKASLGRGVGGQGIDRIRAPVAHSACLYELVILSV